MIRTNIGVFDRGQNAHFVEGILLLFVRQLTHLDLFQRILLAIAVTKDRVHATVSALSYAM